MKIAYLKGYDLAIHSIDWTFKDEFGRQNVTAINADDLGDTDLSEFNMLVFPGCAGEVSPYPRFMSDSAIKNVTEALNNGMILWTDCGGTYEVLENIHFLNSKGEIKNRNGIGYINGEARGPVEGPAIAPSKQDKFLDVVIKRIFYKSAQNMISTVDVCYGNGPGIFLSEEERTNPDIRIIARYDDKEGSPIAALSKKFGQGLLISFGVLVQIAPDHLAGDVPNCSKTSTHRRMLREHLTKAEHQRISLLCDVFNMAHDHVANLWTQQTLAAINKTAQPHVKFA